MHVRQNLHEVAILAPAKVNLFLEVLAKRPDGFHEIETLLLPITLFDELTFRATRHPQIELTCRVVAGEVARLANSSSRHAAHELQDLQIPQGPENLVWKAIALLKQRARVEWGAAVGLIKRTPAAAGLGGASSDAAAALLAANRGWNLGWSAQQLRELGSELGSDIPFFLAKGAAIGRGRGDRMEQVATTRLVLVIVKPPVGLSTPLVYRHCRPAPQRCSVNLARKYLAIGALPLLAKELHNQLQPAATALTPWIERLRGRFIMQGLAGHQMSGSGSSYFGICRSRRHGRRIAATLRSQSLGSVHLAETASTS